MDHTAASVSRNDPAGWLLRPPSPEAEARIFCFPYAGSGASMFSRWPRSAGTAEICPVQLPARENRLAEPHFRTYQALAEQMADELALHLHRPAVFFGHCSGALAAFEAVLRLAEQGLPTPRHLVISAQVAPHDCPYDRFLDCSREQLADELGKLMTRQGGTAHPLLIEFALSVLEQDLNATRVYRRAEPVRIPSRITVVNWSDDPEVSPEQLTGWARYADEVTFLELRGGHYDFLDGPQELLDLLEAATGSDL